MQIIRWVITPLLAFMVSGCDNRPTKMTNNPAPVIVQDSPANDTSVNVRPLADRRLTAAQLKQIKAGMKEADIVAIFGPARKQIIGAEISQAILGDESFALAYEDELNAYKMSGVPLAYAEDGAVLLVGLLNEGEPNPGTVARAWLCVRSGDNLVYDVLTLQNARLVHETKSYPYTRQ